MYLQKFQVNDYIYILSTLDLFNTPVVFIAEVLDTQHQLLDANVQIGIGLNTIGT